MISFTRAYGVYWTCVYYTEIVMLSDPGTGQTSLCCSVGLENSRMPSILTTRKIHTNRSITTLKHTQHFIGLWKQLLKTEQRVESFRQDIVEKFNGLTDMISHPVKAFGWILKSH